MQIKIFSRLCKVVLNKIETLRKQRKCILIYERKERNISDSYKFWNETNRNLNWKQILSLSDDAIIGKAVNDSNMNILTKKTIRKTVIYKEVVGDQSHKG